MPSAKTLERIRPLLQSLWETCMRKAYNKLQTQDRKAVRIEGKRMYKEVVLQIKSGHLNLEQALSSGRK